MKPGAFDYVRADAPVVESRVARERAMKPHSLR